MKLSKKESVIIMNALKLYISAFSEVGNLFENRNLLQAEINDIHQLWQKLKAGLR